MKVSYKSFVDKTIKDLEKAEQKVLIKAGKHVSSKIKRKVNDEYFQGYHSQPGEPPGKITGNLRKGIGYKSFLNSHNVKVGVGPPAQHAHLLEFGTVERKTKKHKTGYIAPRPFIFPTFDEESPEVKKILSEKWL